MKGFRFASRDTRSVEIPFTENLSFKQARSAVLVAVILGLVFSFTQIALDLRKEKDSVATTVRQVLNTVKDTAAEAAFNLDKELGQKAINGLFAYRPILRATIHDDLGTMIAHGERPKTMTNLPTLSKVIFGDISTFTSPLVLEGNPDTTLGEMTVRVDTDLVAANFLDRVWLVLVFGILRNFLLALVLTVVFFVTFTKPLVRAINALHSTRRPAKWEPFQAPVPKGHEGDEIGLLVDTFNALMSDIHKSEERFFLAVQGSNDGLWDWTDIENDVVWWSPRLYEQLGYAPDEVKPSFAFFWKQVHPDDRGGIREAVRRHLEQRIPFVIECRIKAGLPEYRSFLARGQALWDDDGKPIRMAGSFQDITERKTIERQLAQAQKMEAVGQLTGGVAHDFNNLLAVVSLNLELVQEKTAHLPELDELVQRPLGAVRRGATLTQRLLSFSRLQSLSPKPTDLAQLIGGLEDMLRRTLGETIDVRINVADDASQVLVDAHQLESAILNLTLNARDAMPNGGALTIKTANAPLDEQYAREHDEVEAGDYVLLAISDSGTGIPAEALEHVFEPFFTTKEVDKGSGLGLSMVYGFIKQSKGHISVHSAVGNGTSINLYLPKAAPKETDLPAAEENLGVRLMGRERILVVEDEEEVRRVTVQILRAEGYDVIEATDGPEALENIQGSGSIDLLFTDVVLPKGLNGTELAAKAEKMQPGLNTLFTTGYAETAVINTGGVKEGVNLITKPYRRKDLLLRVRSAINAPKE